MQFSGGLWAELGLKMTSNCPFECKFQRNTGKSNDCNHFNLLVATLVDDVRAMRGFDFNISYPPHQPPA
eukprot:150965-Amphidinium_carterae.1